MWCGTLALKRDYSHICRPPHRRSFPAPSSNLRLHGVSHCARLRYPPCLVIARTDWAHAWRTQGLGTKCRGSMLWLLAIASSPQRAPRMLSPRPAT
eukprot:gene8242-biopygen13653